MTIPKDHLHEEKRSQKELEKIKKKSLHVAEFGEDFIN